MTVCNNYNRWHFFCFISISQFIPLDAQDLFLVQQAKEELEDSRKIIPEEVLKHGIRA